MCNHLVLDMRNGFGPGGVASVFFEPSRAWVYKLFKSSGHRDFRGDELPDRVLRELFRSELDAYQLIAGHDDLVRHTPRLAGAVTIAAVLDLNGQDVTAQFLPDCCLQLERISGQEEDLADWVDKLTHLQACARKLNEIGVGFTRDSGVFDPADPERFKIFDFATTDVLAQPI